MHNFCVKNKIASQSKLESTFLEELSIYLIKDNELIKNESLGLFNKNIYAGLKIEKGLAISIPKKDVDFCVGKEITLGLNGESVSIIIPVVAVEVKTYLDATMLGEIQYSSRVIKNAVPNAKTYVLTGYHVVGEDRLSSARTDKSIDEIFVLQESKGKPIKSKTLEFYLKQLNSDIKSIAAFGGPSIPEKLLAQ
ncbi:MAG: Bpu10I family restriction endonuclease [Candidatus Saccharibacteria bacterium]|nr:Bpu10I family restriction endonuclease [Candidatus Saccharibacteria bacterium]